MSAAEKLAKALGGHKVGNIWMALCPAHDDRTPSLSISESSDGKVLVHCHAGCEQRAVIEELRKRGLWDQEDARPVSANAPAKPNNKERALKLWEGAADTIGTPALLYLASRGITIVPPPALRFYPRLKHPSNQHVPAMVALVTNAVSGAPMAIHRTYLATDGSAKADLDPDKAMLGATRGGIVRLAEVSDFVMIAEGIETGLSVLQATGHPVWAALSSSGMQALDLPPQIKNVTILADGDVKGLRAAEIAAKRWTREGRSVRIAIAPDDKDFNDILTSKDGSLTENEGAIAAIVAQAEEYQEPVDEQPDSSKPRLFVDRASPDVVLSKLRDILATAGELYDRGVPVRIAYDRAQKGCVAQEMTPEGLIRVIHSICRPWTFKQGDKVDVLFPRNLAVTYIDWRGEWQLPLLAGIASAPILQDDGGIGVTEGYDKSSCMWVENVPDLSGLIPEWPTRDQAAASLHLIRDTFKKFCFADAEVVLDALQEIPVVDISKPPGRDETAFLVALLTAVCRPSLPFAPAVLVQAALMSGAGAGKGLLTRCICTIAFGREPHAVTGGKTAEEVEKRIGAELMEGNPALFLDNLNNTSFRSDLLASAITERPSRVRVLGKSRMITLNASAFIILTGNGLTVSEDLARRFITIELDAGTENPESRAFPNDIKADVRRRRRELLAALLTIWRWGRQAADLALGIPHGGFEQWSRWVRDPLLALGCHDPVARISEAKARDPQRQVLADIFDVWWKHHGDKPVAVSGLHEDVTNAINPLGRTRQYVARQVELMSGMRIAGYQLIRQKSSKSGVAMYALKASAESHWHKGHGGHRPDGLGEWSSAPTNSDPMPPVPPMPTEPVEEITQDIDEAGPAPDGKWRARI